MLTKPGNVPPALSELKVAWFCHPRSRNWESCCEKLQSDVYSVRVFGVFDDLRGRGPALYVGGRFDSIQGKPTFCLARWFPAGGVYSRSVPP